MACISAPPFSLKTPAKAPATELGFDLADTFKTSIFNSSINYYSILLFPGVSPPIDKLYIRDRLFYIPFHSTNARKKSHNTVLLNFFRLLLAFFTKLTYNSIEVIPLIASLISNPNTPFNKRDRSGLFCFTAIALYFIPSPCYNIKYYETFDCIIR